MSGRATREPEAYVRVPAGDGAGYDEFYRQTYAPLLRLMVSMTSRRAVAEELTQEAMFSAYRNWSRVGTLERPDLWLRRVAINRAISRHRRLRAEVAAVTRLRAERPHGVQGGDDGAVWSAVRRLPGRQQAAISLWAVSGYTLAEIGAVLGCSEETARTHLRRARSRLAATLGVDE